MLTEDQWNELLALVEPGPLEVQEAEAMSTSDGFVLELARFGARLKMAATLYAHMDQRAGVHAAASVTADFIQAVAGLSTPEILAPFAGLLSAVLDSDKGIQPKLFVPNEPPSHRPEAPTDEQAIWAYAAVVMELLMKELRYPKDKAARVVYEELRRSGIRVGNPRTQSSGANAVARWRDRVLERSKTGDFAAYIFTYVAPSFKPKISNMRAAGHSSDSIAKVLLQKLAAICLAVHGPRKSAYPPA
jgi:hypothetical protein